MNKAWIEHRKEFMFEPGNGDNLRGVDYANSSHWVSMGLDRDCTAQIIDMISLFRNVQDSKVEIATVVVSVFCFVCSVLEIAT